MILRLSRKRAARWAACVSSGMMAFSFLSSCDDRLVALTNFVDPCGTILANCAPGSFQSLNADLGDWCLDPACTVPGGCGDPGPPLGTIRDICP